MFPWKCHTRTTGFLARHQINSCSSKSEFFGLNVLFGGIEAQKKIFFQSCSEIGLPNDMWHSAKNPKKP